MPRRPRVLASRTLYHVYSRITRREGIFSYLGEPEGFVDLIRRTKDRDGFEILAWCLMTNHVHLLIRTGEVPLSRSMRTIQGRFAVSFNRRHNQIGPLWQSRYKAKVVVDDMYFRRLVAYIHLNPVAAGIVSRPALYRWSGHAELIGRRRPELVDVERTLELFGDDDAVARREYLRLVAAVRKVKRDRPDGATAITADEAIPKSDQRAGERAARPPVVARKVLDPAPLDAHAFLQAAVGVLGCSEAELSGHRQDGATTRAREALVLVGTELVGLRLTALAAALGKSSDSAAHWVTRGARRRRGDPAFAELVQSLRQAVGTR